MSQENVDVLSQFIDAWQKNIDTLRRFSDAFNRRDLAALMSCCDNDVVIATAVLIDAPIYRGQRGIEQWFRDVAVAWEDLRAEARRVIAVGDGLVVVGDAFGTGQTAGVPFESREMATYFKFAHGKVARCEFFANEREALEAAGLRE
jgi:ketosteroid isomerase-like protein